MWSTGLYQGNTLHNEPVTLASLGPGEEKSEQEFVMTH